MPTAKKGMLRIGYTNKKTKFEYRGLTRDEVPEKLGEHLACFARETTFEGPHRVEVNRVIDPRTVVAEWVEDEGTKDEKVSRVEVPIPPTE